MIGRPGTLVWLLGNELRLARRRRNGWRGRPGLAAGVSLVVFVLLACAVGIPFGLLLSETAFVPSPVASAVAALGMLAIFTLMLSQGLSSAAEALYERADLDLLFSSPIDPTRVLVVRFLSVAVLIFWTFGFFLAGPVVVIAILGHPNWLGGIVVLAALALSAAGLGLLMSSALFRSLGPRRTRTVAQVLSAFIGAAFFLAFQVPNILGHERTPDLIHAIRRVAARAAPGVPGLDWPLRAVLGEPLPLAAALAIGIAVFTLASLVVGPRFAADAAAASGAGATAKARAGRSKAFADGLFRVTLRKELRLLGRDPGLLAQVLMRVVYLLPLGFILLRNAWRGDDVTLAATAGALAVMAGQIAGSLAWITVSAEDAPELIASAPAAFRRVQQGKLAAAVIPVAMLVTPVLLPLVVAAPRTGLAAILGSAVAITATSLVNLWWQRPGDRRAFLRRRGFWVVSLAELALSLLTGSATVLAATGYWLWALVPLALVGATLLALRRSEARILDALRAAG